MAAKKKILVLSASAGAGHVRAAEALMEEFQRHPDAGEMAHWDMLKYTTKLFRHIYSQVYLDLIAKAPTMLGWIYDTTDTPWKNEKRRLVFEKFNAGPFLKVAAKFNPDVIVCTHFTPANLIAHLFETNKISVKPAIAVTDFDCHAMWLVRSYAHYFVAIEETRVHLERLGIDPARVTVSGIPVHPVFRLQKDRASARRDLGLDPAPFTILVCAGGYGVGPIELLIRELMHLKTRAQVVAIAGRGAPLKAALDALAADQPADAPVRLVSVGFTSCMEQFMAAADIIITKPGGLTISEALALGVPICVMNPIPGQEERNSDHLLESQAAVRCNNLATLSYKLGLLIEHPERLSVLRQNALNLGRPFAARTIVNTLLADDDGPPTGAQPTARPSGLQ